VFTASGDACGSWEPGERQADSPNTAAMSADQPRPVVAKLVRSPSTRGEQSRALVHLLDCLGCKDSDPDALRVGQC